MIPVQDPLSALTYGQIHVIELGGAIGLLAATVYRSDRYTAYAILGLSGGIIALQRLLQEIPDVVETTFRIASMPLFFLVPMLTAFGLGVGVIKAVRARTQSEEHTEMDERPAD